MVNCSVFLTLYVICGKSLIICSFVITELVRQPIQDRRKALEYGGTSRDVGTRGTGIPADFERYIREAENAYYITAE